LVSHHPLLSDQVQASTTYDRIALVLLPLQVEQQYMDLETRKTAHTDYITMPIQRQPTQAR
jgi:hypothetical protein